MSQLVGIGVSALCVMAISYGMDAEILSSDDAGGVSSSREHVAGATPSSPAFTAAPVAGRGRVTGPVAAPSADLLAAPSALPPSPREGPVIAVDPPPRTEPTAPLGAAPAIAYRVIAERTTDRSDKANTYYVVIPPIDVGTEGFKDTVRSVLRALAASNGGPQFTVHVWDLEAAAETELSYNSNPYAFSDELFEAKDRANDQHFIATYTGAMVYAGQQPENLLYWFPTSAHTSSNVGKWVSAEVWDPI